MKAHYIESIKEHKSYKILQKRRKQLALKLTAAMLIVYFSFVLSIAFFPNFLAEPIYKGSVITRGIPLGIFIIIFAIALTGYYVYRANKEFDLYTREIHKDIVEP